MLPRTRPACPGCTQPILTLFVKLTLRRTKQGLGPRTFLTGTAYFRPGGSYYYYYDSSSVQFSRPQLLTVSAPPKCPWAQHKLAAEEIGIKLEIIGWFSDSGRGELSWGVPGSALGNWRRIKSIFNKSEYSCTFQAKECSLNPSAPCRAAKWWKDCLPTCGFWFLKAIDFLSRRCG